MKLKSTTLLVSHLEKSASKSGASKKAYDMLKAELVDHSEIPFPEKLERAKAKEKSSSELVFHEDRSWSKDAQDSNTPTIVLTFETSHPATPFPSKFSAPRNIEFMFSALLVFQPPRSSFISITFSLRRTLKMSEKSVTWRCGTCVKRKLEHG